MPVSPSGRKLSAPYVSHLPFTPLRRSTTIRWSASTLRISRTSDEARSCHWSIDVGTIGSLTRSYPATTRLAPRRRTKDLGAASPA